LSRLIHNVAAHSLDARWDLIFERISSGLLLGALSGFAGGCAAAIRRQGEFNY
jgi:hypothetical protein